MTPHPSGRVEPFRIRRGTVGEILVPDAQAAVLPYPAGVPAPLSGQRTAAALGSWGLAPETVADLTSAGGIR
ncbi:hypothetical protein [Kutzneria buriramensis]|uniref:Uncharacterized protein n=1 Tax=Kutzneria buriramensis TaxID=1045776 RepID=A0A3E0G5H6_9PSEU|nr:hypothetical protein [Kutzneria buriramensis]REH18121.1 hypothetical protein BCF44_1378 [Kutzneria buriramensis]